MTHRPIMEAGFPRTSVPVSSEASAMTRRGFLGITAAMATAALMPGCDRHEDTFDDARMVGELYKVRPLTRSITAQVASTTEAVATVVQWVEKNFLHYYVEEGEDWSSNPYSYDEAIVGSPLRISIEELFRERIVGCHYASAVVAVMLRSIDIYANYEKTKIGYRGYHGVVHIPELDSYVHGDPIADLVGIPGHELMLTRDELEYWWQHPGYPAEELGYPAGSGMISEGIYALYIPLNEKYGYTIAGPRLRRQGNSLYIWGFLPEETLEQGLATLISLCPEYDLELGEQTESGNYTLISKHVPIQPLVW